MSIKLPENFDLSRGLYDPTNEKDSCGVGFIAHIKGVRSHQIVADADLIGCSMEQRGARGAEVNTGDGAGILTALPLEFLAKVARTDLGTELPDPGHGQRRIPEQGHSRNIFGCRRSRRDGRWGQPMRGGSSEDIAMIKL